MAGRGKTPSGEQKRRLCFLQASYIECVTRKYRTLAERDRALIAHTERVVAEPDRYVSEAFTLWIMREANVGEVTIAWPDGTETTKSFTEH